MIQSMQVVPCDCRYEHLIDHFAVRLDDYSGDVVNICVPTERQAEELNDRLEVAFNSIEEVWLNTTDEESEDDDVDTF